MPSWLGVNEKKDVIRNLSLTLEDNAESVAEILVARDSCPTKIFSLSGKSCP